MNDELTQTDELHYVAKADDFNEGFKALQVAEWVTDPTDPTNMQGGLIRKGETIWFHQDHFGSGPEWTLARFANKTLGYVHLADFKKIEPVTAPIG